MINIIQSIWSFLIAGINLSESSVSIISNLILSFIAIFGMIKYNDWKKQVLYEKKMTKLEEIYMLLNEFRSFINKNYKEAVGWFVYLKIEEVRKMFEKLDKNDVPEEVSKRISEFIKFLNKLEEVKMLLVLHFDSKYIDIVDEIKKISSKQMFLNMGFESKAVIKIEDGELKTIKSPTKEEISEYMSEHIEIDNLVEIKVKYIEENLLKYFKKQ